MKFVYLFKEGNANMRELLGGKGANLAEMTNLGLPIPQGFTITTEACIDYYNNNQAISKEIEEQIFDALNSLIVIFCLCRFFLRFNQRIKKFPIVL